MDDLGNRIIFVSSTFRDMQTERDILRDVVLPQINEFAAQYGCRVELVDLRWGVDTTGASEEEQSRKVLYTCLDEIDRSRPFFIGILGDRYGWVPPGETLGQIAGALSDENIAQSLASGEYREKSVTALEIEYGALRAADPPECYFYMRQADYSVLSDEVRSRYVDDPENLVKQNRLKAGVTSRFPARVRDYPAVIANNEITGLEEFARMVTSDIVAGLCAEWGEPPQQAFSTQEQEARSLVAFRREHIEGFVGREEELSFLREVCLGEAEASVVLVQGVGGNGKSALMCKLMDEVAPHCFLLPFSCGLTPSSSRLEGLLRAFIWRLSAFLDQQDDGEALTSFEDLRERFHSLLRSAARQVRVVAVVDALDQLQDSDAARHMLWLSGALPANFRLVGSIVGGPEVEEVQRMGGQVRSITPFTMNEAEAVIQAAARRHRKEIPGRVIYNLYQKRTGDGERSAHSPLYLTLMVQDLAMLDRYEHNRIDELAAGGLSPMEAIVRYMTQRIDEIPGDAEGVYLALADRAGRLIGKEFVDTTLGLIAASRYGLRESDLAAGFAWLKREGVLQIDYNPADFSWLRQYLGGHLVQGGFQQWDFAHQSLRQACLNAPYDEMLNWGCYASANHFYDIFDSDEMALQELMYHLWLVDEWGCAAEAVAFFYDSVHFDVLARGLLDVFIRQGGEDCLPEEDFILCILTAAMEGVKPEYRHRIAEMYRFNLKNALANVAKENYHIRYLEKVMDMMNQTQGQEESYMHQSTAMLCMESLQSSYYATENNERMEYYKQAAAAMFQKISTQYSDEDDVLDVNIKKFIDSMRCLAKEDPQAAEQGLKKILLRLRALCGKNPAGEYLTDLSFALHSLGELYSQQKRDEEALSMLNEALAVVRQDSNQINYWYLHRAADSLAEHFAARGDFAAAEEYYRKAWSAPAGHYEITGDIRALELVANAGLSLAEFLLKVAAARPHEAPQRLRQAIEYFEKAGADGRLLSEKTGNVAILVSVALSYLYLADHYWKNGKEEKSYEFYKKTLEQILDLCSIAQPKEELYRGAVQTGEDILFKIQRDCETLFSAEPDYARHCADRFLQIRIDFYQRTGEAQDLQELVALCASQRRYGQALPFALEWAGLLESAEPSEERTENLCMAYDTAVWGLEELDRKEEAAFYRERAAALRPNGS